MMAIDPDMGFDDSANTPDTQGYHCANTPDTQGYDCANTPDTQGYDCANTHYSANAHAVWVKKYPAWPLPGAAAPGTLPEQRVRWAVKEPLDEALEKSIARLSATAPRPVRPEEEQTRGSDEQACFEQHAPEYWDAITSEPLPAALTSAARQEELGFRNSWKVWMPLAGSRSRRAAALSSIVFYNIKNFGWLENNLA